RAGTAVHEAPLPGAVVSGLPRAFGAHHMAVLVQRLGRLAEIPDIPVPVLGVPIDGVLGQPAAEIQAISDDATAHTEDHLRSARDAEAVDRRLTVLHALVHERGAGPQWEVGVVNAVHEAVGAGSAGGGRRR